VINFPKKEILMDYIIRLCDFLMGKNVENSEKNPKIQIKFRKIQINPKNPNRFQKI
jgi:hypothetical protein